MITLFHGEDSVSSRRSFVGFKDENSRSFDAENLNAFDLQQALSGQALFSDSKKIFLENIFSKKVKDLDPIVKLLNEAGKEFDIYLWDKDQVSEKQQSLIKGLKNQEFKVPKNIWTFLDNIRPSNKSSVTMFHKVLEEADENIIFSMMLRQFRLLLAVSSGLNKIDEAKRLAPWQKSKLMRQSGTFSQEKLRKAYERLYEIDKNHKTGVLSFPLSKSIDFFLIGL